jgi:hypothetical protein
VLFGLNCSKISFYTNETRDGLSLIHSESMKIVLKMSICTLITKYILWKKFCFVATFFIWEVETLSYSKYWIFYYVIYSYLLKFLFCFVFALLYNDDGLLLYRVIINDGSRSKSCPCYEILPPHCELSIFVILSVSFFRWKVRWWEFYLFLSKLTIESKNIELFCNQFNSCVWTLCIHLFIIFYMERPP